MSRLPQVCLSCNRVTCESSNVQTLGVCEYNVSFYNDGTSIVRTEGLVPLSKISQNLRHEVNGILNVIVEEATRIDGTVSARRIDPENAASRIVGAAGAIDHFIQMVTSVNEYNPGHTRQIDPNATRRLSDMVHRHFEVYHIVENSRTPKVLQLSLEGDSDVDIHHCAAIVDYLVAIFVDNAWKYAIPNTLLTVFVRESPEDLFSVEFVNEARPIPRETDIFFKGVQGSSESPGFGYGLYWAKILEHHYNRIHQNDENHLHVSHHEEPISATRSRQRFAIHNLRGTYRSL